MDMGKKRFTEIVRGHWCLSGGLFLFLIFHVSPIRASAQARIEADYGELPLYFEATQGQEESPVQYLARSLGYTVLLTPSEAVISLPGRGTSGIEGSASPDRSATVTMQFVGGHPAPSLVGEQRLPSVSHYFVGNDPRRWRTDVPHYGRIRYQNVYPGVDLIYYGNQGRLEYDFIVAPEANPARINLAFQGVDRLEVKEDGALAIHTSAGILHQRPPVMYQTRPGSERTRRPVAGGYVLRGPYQVGFQIAHYDTELELIIDPVLEYSTYLGDSEIGWDVAVDAEGHAYVVGQTRSPNFPTTGLSFGGGRDAFVAKLNASGTGLIFSTFLGGSASEVGRGIEVDTAGNAYVVGETASSDFPTTAGVFQTARAGTSTTDAFVTKLNRLGSLLYSTYLGGTGLELGHAIAIDGAGNAHVTGRTQSTDFPTTALAVQPVPGANGGDAFVTQLNASGSGLVFSTYLGGTKVDEGSAIAVDSLGHVHLTGMTSSADFPTTGGAVQSLHGGGTNDAFVAQLDGAGSTLVYSTYLGGLGQDFGHGIAVDTSWSVYVAGTTNSANFPVTSGVIQPVRAGNHDAFVSRLSATGALVYSTYLGGTRREYGRAIALGPGGNVYLTGNTASADFPVTAGAPQPISSRLSDAFVSQLSPDGSLLVLSTYLGGNGSWDIGYGIAIDSSGSAYVTGHTRSSDFPITPGALQATRIGSEDAFVTKLTE